MKKLNKAQGGKMATQRDCLRYEEPHNQILRDLIIVSVGHTGVQHPQRRRGEP
ncbi:hypothetical protein DVH05_022513 [Phytophthora capsici]|nr:hypothetical protein DVH05_022513 [Phytophthora capsici]